MLSVNQLKQLDVFSHKEITHIRPLNGGLCHRLYQLTYLDDSCSLKLGIHKQCVLRYLTTHAQESGIEYQIMQHAYLLGIGPKPLALIDLADKINQFPSLIVMDFIDGQLASSDNFNDDDVTKLATLLTTLHQSDITALKVDVTTNSLALLDIYWCQFTQKNTADIQRFSTVKRLLKRLTFNNTSLIHGDLNLSNILINNGIITWLDWEFSSRGDRYIDYAALCVESDGKIDEKLISALEHTLPLEVTIDPSRLVLFKLYYATLCWLWQPALTGQSTVNQHRRYEKIVDQLLTATFSDDINSS